MSAKVASDTNNLKCEIKKLGLQARASAKDLSLSSDSLRRTAINNAADELLKSKIKILEANKQDILRAHTNDLSSAMLDRLALDNERIDSMIVGLKEVATLDDPVGSVLDEWTRPNGLRIQKVSVPIGVIGIIYESRPNVTSDAAALCLMSGNAAILRCGSESLQTSKIIAACLRSGVKSAGLPEDCVQLIPTVDRSAVGILLSMDEDVDIIIPRGGRSLIERVKMESRIPVLSHLDGICHVYVQEAADPKKASSVSFNAKMRRTGICGATETLLIDRAALDMLPEILSPFFSSNCEIRGDDEVCSIDSRVVKATEADWKTEYLDAIISVKVVEGINEAIKHINAYGSHHTDAIITEDKNVAAQFLSKVDSAIVVHNASTQFADGGEFGMGAEIGISNGKLHARGPVGVQQLTTYKYKVFGTGQVRP